MLSAGEFHSLDRFYEEIHHAKTPAFHRPAGHPDSCGLCSARDGGARDARAAGSRGDRRRGAGRCSRAARLRGPIIQENWPEAARLNQESFACAQAVGAPCAMVSALTNLGWSRMCAGAWEAAAALFEQAYEIAQQAGHVKGVAVSQAILGWIALHQGDTSSAAALARKSLHLCHLLGEREVLAECLEILAAVSVSEGDAGRAAELNTAATALWEALRVIRPPTRYATSLLGHGSAAMQKPPGGAFEDVRRQARHFYLDTIVAFALDCGGAPGAALIPQW